jgi:plasmid stabilization system protein ParE
MKPRWTARARDDLKAIGRFIARERPRAARAWVARLQERARLAARAPRAGRVVPEIGQDDVREVLVSNYRIVYRIRGRAVEILTVFEGHRLLRRADVAGED